LCFAHGVKAESPLQSSIFAFGRMISGRRCYRAGNCKRPTQPGSSCLTVAVALFLVTLILAGCAAPPSSTKPSPALAPAAAQPVPATANLHDSGFIARIVMTNAPPMPPGLPNLSVKTSSVVVPPPAGPMTNIVPLIFPVPTHNCNWSIQSSPDLKTWITLCSWTNGGSGVIHWTDQTTNANNFYREQVSWK
jgi:hypothetical protein